MKLQTKPAINVVILAIPMDLKETHEVRVEDGLGQFHVIRGSATMNMEQDSEERTRRISASDDRATTNPRNWHRLREPYPTTEYSVRSHCVMLIEMKRRQSRTICLRLPRYYSFKQCGVLRTYYSFNPINGLNTRLFPPLLLCTPCMK